jgi:predicted negative regulator of RcsB-dependent stress response
MRPAPPQHRGAARVAFALFALALVSSATEALAQVPLTLPQPSPAASAAQRVGVTDITITYHRPAVNKREVWGKLVPWNEVWRAGANENTVISFSTPVSVGGHQLPAGAYGLHMIPTDHGWTVIFNRESRAWGSFFYEPSEDAARVDVTPVPSGFEEHLAYTFDDPTEKSVVATLRWEKLAVPIRIDVDTPAVVAASLHEELRGLAGFSWQRFAQAAQWCAANNVNLDEAGKWADKAVGLQENFTTLRAKADVIDRQGNQAAAAELRTRSLKLATEVEMNAYGYQLLQSGKVDEAVAMFRENIKRHPDSWNAYDSLGEALALKGSLQEAIDSYRKALAMTADAKQKERITGILAKL